MFRRLSLVHTFSRSVAHTKTSLATKHMHALWINMREEPVVYINGSPFVLRDEVREKKHGSYIG